MKRYAANIPDSSAGELCRSAGDQMIRSLNAHRNELRVMKEKHIVLLQQWRDRCSNDDGTMVAYFLDY
jgi:hypothetical protein